MGEGFSRERLRSLFGLWSVTLNSFCVSTLPRTWVCHVSSLGRLFWVAQYCPWVFEASAGTKFFLDPSRQQKQKKERLWLFFPFLFFLSVCLIKVSSRWRTGGNVWPFFLQLSGVSIAEKGPSRGRMWLSVTPGWSVLSEHTSCRKVFSLPSCKGAYTVVKPADKWKSLVSLTCGVGAGKKRLGHGFVTDEAWGRERTILLCSNLNACRLWSLLWLRYACFFPHAFSVDSGPATWKEILLFWAWGLLTV